MKKIVLLIGVIISVVCQMNVMAKTVSITVHRKGNVDRSTTVCRRPINLPIDVVYDNDARQITVSGDEEMMAQVFLCDANGNTLDYSSTINVTFYVPEVCTETLIIRIEAEDWIAEGEVPLN